MSQMNTEGVVLEAATGVHSRAFIDMWVPMFMVRKSRDKTWTYRLFQWHQILQHPGLKSYAAVDGQRTLEGLLATSAQPPYLKVDFVATAPWNHGEPKRRKGVGSGLIGAAIMLSKEMGLGGVLILASTPESETYYEHMGFERTGERDQEGLAVFRLTPERAEKIIQAYPVIPMRR